MFQMNCEVSKNCKLIVLINSPFVLILATRSDPDYDITSRIRTVAIFVITAKQRIHHTDL